MGGHWDRLHGSRAERIHAGAGTSFAHEVHAAIAPAARILELGCGAGHDATHFAAHGHTVVATDASAVAVDNNRARRSVAGLSFRRLDIAGPFAGFEDSQFDVVFACLSLHYFTDRVTRQILDEIGRVLAPGGKLCFMCRSVEDPLHGHGVQLEADMFDLDGHVRHFFSPDYVRSLLPPDGPFIIDRLWTTTEEVYGYPSALVKVIATRR